MRVYIPLALAASTVAALNLRHQDSPLVILGHPPQDSMDFAVHPRRVLKVQTGRKLAQETNRLRFAELPNQQESDASSGSRSYARDLLALGTFETAGRGCGKVVGAVCGTALGPALGVAQGLRGKVAGGRVGGTILGAAFGPIAGYQSGKQILGQEGAKLGKKIDDRRAQRKAAKQQRRSS
ncbi:hypothetical protein LEN26_011891 [Aphanomyces euteiches]|nr:hypothetical protein LEN26_011891 [Aphanomyces euteiches]